MHIYEREREMALLENPRLTDNVFFYILVESVNQRVKYLRYPSELSLASVKI